MVHEFRINGCLLKTGDIICTNNGRHSIYSVSYWALGKQLPGEVDHTVLYVGPGGLCVEAGIFGVTAFTTAEQWDSQETFAERGLMDSFVAATSVLACRGLSCEEEYAARSCIRTYALRCVGKPHNKDFHHPDNDQSLYCSQLVYLAYKMVGINLKVGATGIPDKWSDIIVFPQNIYDNTTVIPAVGCEM